MADQRQDGYPNVRARLRRTRQAPGTPPAETSLVIWLRGAEFRVRDETGRPYADIVGDVTAARGFGVTPRTMEGFMDAWDANQRASERGPTELYGDRETGEAVVHEAGREPWAIDPEVIAPVAEQLLSNGREATLDPVGAATYLDRRCREYRFVLAGEEDGIGYRGDVRWLVWAPYLLLREVRDSRHPDLSALTEVVELAEGAVADADLRPHGATI